MRGSIVGALLAVAGPVAGQALPSVHVNPNIERAGVLRDRVLTITLEAVPSRWWPDGPNQPAMTIPAFAESGNAPLIPGPLMRAPQGTAIRFALRNRLSLPFVFVVPSAIHGGPRGRRAVDSVTVAPGDSAVLTTQATNPGNYVYRAAAGDRALRQGTVVGLLAGAIVIDSAGAQPSADRVFVIMATADSVLEAEAARRVVNFNAPDVGRLIFTINGHSWPRTDRLIATVGDSLHWRVVNASSLFHPMHLHGFYYRVDAFSDPRADSLDDEDPSSPGRMVVTQLLPPLATMTMTWSPDRPGTWIFHCHFARHLRPDSISAMPGDHERRGMVGLVMGIDVRGRATRRAASTLPARRLRLVAIADSSDGGTLRSMRFVLEEHGRRSDAGPGFSPELALTRGEPVSIMVLNQLAVPTSVHWHGIELDDAYFDGVPGVSGAGQRRAPLIAPGDSFEVRFTPPRAGTFMYHAHVDEVRQQASGLLGPLIVRDAHDSSSHDFVVFILGSRFATGSALMDAGGQVVINGRMNPDTIVLHREQPARFRLISLASANPEPRVLLTTRPDSVYALEVDTSLVQWRLIAKDGAALPANGQTVRAAQQTVSMGETYDFEFMPDRVGTLRLEVRVNRRFGGNLLGRVPIRVVE